MRKVSSFIVTIGSWRNPGPNCDVVGTATSTGHGTMLHLGCHMQLLLVQSAPMLPMLPVPPLFRRRVGRLPNHAPTILSASQSSLSLQAITWNSERLLQAMHPILRRLFTLGGRFNRPTAADGLLEGKRSDLREQLISYFIAPSWRRRLLIPAYGLSRPPPKESNRGYLYLAIEPVAGRN